ncbi:hypothetical protein CPB83DRAFT_844789 [Crepidotus variabilis]|uniref:Uncharacterized protein n=1 Tax=Crepidotus variabilis TaxID=179855 RepID=A0A9P6ERI9_9AGAR|nr:hypothetical protein CPB83DRAFT_844789 [Crepidotus variabilis]
MGNFSSKPKVIVVPGVTARIHKYPVFGNGQDDMETMENAPLTSKEFHDVLAKCHLDLSMFFENAQKKTFTIDPSPGDKGIVFENRTEKCNYKLVFYRDQDPTAEKMIEGDPDSWTLQPFLKAEEDEFVKHTKPSSERIQTNDDPDSWSVSTLVGAGEKTCKDVKTQPVVDMEHRYDPKTKTLILDHRYTCNVNARDRSRKWIMNGIEQSDLAGTVPARNFMKFGDVYGLKSKSTAKQNTALIEKREGRELAGCSPVFL